MSERRWPTPVAGRRLQGSIAEFENACLVLMGDELEKHSPNSALIRVLADAVRLGREYVDSKRLVGTHRVVAIMDENTCNECARANGQIGWNTPIENCSSTVNCRCVSRPESESET